jgi:hypothetical protein
MTEPGAEAPTKWRGDFTMWFGGGESARGLIDCMAKGETVPRDLFEDLAAAVPFPSKMQGVPLVVRDIHLVGSPVQMRVVLEEQ